MLQRKLLCGFILQKWVDPNSMYTLTEKMEYYNKCTTPLSGIFERASERETDREKN